MKTIELKEGAWSAILAPDYGMNPISLRKNGQPVLREPADEKALEETPVLFGMPILFPANRTQNARFTFEGREYRLPMNEPERSNHLHGCLCRTPFTVTECTANTATSFFDSHTAPDCYPFSFSLTFRDSIGAEGFFREVVLTNTGNTAMPFTLAFHTTFTEPDTFSVPIGKWYEWDENLIPTGRLIGLDDTELSFRDSCVPRGREISAYYTAEGRTARIGRWNFTVSELFDHWIMYNGNGYEGYLCVEPQCGKVNGLNSADPPVLPPKASASFRLAITE